MGSLSKSANAGVSKQYSYGLASGLLKYLTIVAIILTNVTSMRGAGMQYADVANILGGEKVLGHRLRSRMDFVELGGAGVTKDAASHLAKYLSLSLTGIARLLPVTPRTLQRYGARKRLSPAVSEQVLQLAEVVATGTEIFRDRESFISWLSLPSAALGGKKPLDLLSSRFGAEMVTDELGRIAHGIPA